MRTFNRVLIGVCAGMFAIGLGASFVMQSWLGGLLFGVSVLGILLCAFAVDEMRRDSTRNR